LFLGGLPAAAAGGTPELVRPDPAKLLVFDRRLGSPLKEGKNPLLRSDQPWENATKNDYPNVLWDAESGLWKL